MHLEQIVLRWHEQILLSLNKLQAEIILTTKGHETLIAEQKKFRDNALVLNQKLEAKAETAEMLMTDARNFDHEAHYKKLRNRFLVFHEIGQSWLVLYMAIIVSLSFGCLAGVNMPRSWCAKVPLLCHPRR